MNRIVLATALSAAIAAPAIALADDPAQTDSPPAEEASPHALTGNLALVSSYRFRGIDQTFGKPALQGGFDYAHASGFYLGNWNSNVSSGAGFPEGNLEMDFYGGYKASFGDFGIDLGAIYYYYPGSTASILGTGANSGAVHNAEVYLGASWKFLSLKYFYAVDDYFSLRGVNSLGQSTGQSTRGTQYLDLSANYDLGDGWGINAHLGRLFMKNVSDGDYTDWKLGVTKDISGWVLALSYIGTNAAGDCSGATTYQPYCFSNSNSDVNGVLTYGSHFKDAGRGIAVVSVSRTF
ncbi:TorF family putative porin [Accumulibacter sp.]|uniref:TorF family putative porin n=1 Tax=Accumulibacter sp. TaxID=2053492 RepID=UPI0025E7D3D4|nr:TorF family putative porin [Accumulibacter sp.]MCM8595521.1 TorF family putative porin [Accumulibacter sp.]MCM8626874.1 TorF family putative porin [Accumulibacter sp.]MDS4049668.1 TorF family putative porin [Accumulibacter sp.]